MSGTDLSVFRAALLVVGLLAIAGCSLSEPAAEPRRTVQLQQKWELQPGDAVAGYPVKGGLGDISIAVNGNSVYAPVDGILQPHSTDCVIFSSAELPIYLFRLCGLKKPKFGQRRTGEAIGIADTLNFSVLNRRSNDKWAFVEPSKQILERMLKQP